MLTKKQKQILDYIEKFIKKNDYSPSFEEMRKRFKLASRSTVYHHIEALKSKGYLNKLDYKARSIEISDNQKSSGLINIPLLGTIAAGEPIEAIEDKEIIAVPKNKLPRTGEIYALRVIGNSMIDENIIDGDIILVKQQSVAENGQKVVALIDNYEATLKKFYQEKRGIKLQPANKKIEPIFIEPSRLIIQGVVIDIIKSKYKTELDAKKIIRNTLPKEKHSKGNYKIVYQGKTKEEEIICETKAVKLKLIKKYGINKVNKLILGNNLEVLKTFYNDPEIKGKIDLIYIDPPFGTGQDFVGYNNNGYSDRLINAEFLEFLRKRLVLLRELLSKSGSIYLHINQKIGHYVKIIMDEVFGEENFRNDITRIKCNPKNFERKAFGNIKDVIYFYSKSKPNSNDPMYWTDYRLPISKEEIAKQFPKIDKFGRRYATTPLHAKGETRNGPTGQIWKGLKPPKGRHWRYIPDELTKLNKQGLIEWSPTGNPRKIIYADENKGRKTQDIWDFKDPGFEKSIYPTEKNKDMLKHIILASSKEGDVILDCFAGSGTTLVAAEELNRKWIGIDSNEQAIRVTKKRLLDLNKNNNLFSKPVSFSIYRASY